MSPPDFPGLIWAAAGVLTRVGTNSSFENWKELDSPSKASPLFHGKVTGARGKGSDLPKATETGWAQGLCLLALLIHKPLGLPTTFNEGQSWQAASLGVGSAKNKPYSFTGGGEGWSWPHPGVLSPQINFQGLVCLVPHPEYRAQKWRAFDPVPPPHPPVIPG